MTPEQQKFEQLVIAYQQTFNTETGQKVLDHLKSLYNFGNPNTGLARNDLQQTFKEAAQHDVILRIQAMVAYDLNQSPKQWVITQETD